MTVVNLHGYRD